MMAETPILDVRTEIPQRRHELIFEHYHALKPGESYILLNDHDPIPLYYQFEAEYKGKYVWNSIEEGPVDWRVEIGKP